ncbi:hypothetical protein LCGC14_1934390 [marine sediment metagenome]|uniref:Uncharacterized protein n=1 Tax=marine sediment metagenome TaxID=412755 RepID=A0A0F9IJP2_9ZZZZ
MYYKWKRQPFAGADADVIGEHIESLAKDGIITPADLVKDAAKKSSPLHKCFEWDDTTAAKAYRITQAQYILRQINVMVERGDETSFVVRAFHHVSSEEQQGYTTIESALKDPELWNCVLMQAVAEIKAFQQKYKDITEFGSLFGEIDKL